VWITDWQKTWLIVIYGSSIDFSISRPLPNPSLYISTTSSPPLFASASAGDTSHKVLTEANWRFHSHRHTIVLIPKMCHQYVIHFTSRSRTVLQYHTHRLSMMQSSIVNRGRRVWAGELRATTRLPWLPWRHCHHCCSSTTKTTTTEFIALVCWSMIPSSRRCCMLLLRICYFGHSQDNVQFFYAVLLYEVENTGAWPRRLSRYYFGGWRSCTEAEGNMYQQRRKIVVSVRAAQDK